MASNEQVLANPVTDNPLPCFVHHEAAGGRCGRWATMQVYGLCFCEAHGEDAKLGVASWERHEAWTFFERFRNESVPSIGGRIGVEIAALTSRLLSEPPSGSEEQAALLRAYPEATDETRRHVDADDEDEPGVPPLYDSCQDDIYMLHRLMRIAYEEGATWLVEKLELERESISALAAEALRRQKSRSEVGPRPAG